MDYTYFDKECYHRIDELDNLENYDLFISMFVDSDRVKETAYECGTGGWSSDVGCSELR